VAAPSRFFEGAEGLIFRMSWLATERKRIQNPDTLKLKWSAPPLLILPLDD
jgi:hypothetical protein